MKELYRFVFFNVVLILSLFYLSYWVHTRKEDVSIFEFINKGKKLPSTRDLAVGLVFGIVFGFIDNFGLWMGIDSLQKYMPGGILTKSALGNTYSDFLGATMGSFIAIMADDIFEYDDSKNPIWLTTFGIVVGCLLGLAFGRIVTGKQ